MKIKHWKSQLSAAQNSALIIRLLGFAAVIFIYTYQAYRFADAMPVNTDEGSYLAKGWLFVSGTYMPFQDYGPWTNKMPLAFIIPGLAQYLFGPGLLTGRVFSIVLGVLMLVGFFITLKRFTHYWIAMALLLIIALNPILVQYYTLATSQIIVAALLSWFFAAVLGKQRKLWQLIAGTVLCILILFTRQNMFPLLPLFLAYTFWAHGKKAGWISTGVGLILFIFIHMLYWPNILDIWSSVLIGPLEVVARGLRIDLSATLAGSSPVLQANYSGLSKLMSFWEGTRNHIIPFIAIAITWILWPARKKWTCDADFKDSVFLLATLLILWGIHFSAAFFGNYCLNCYSGYLAFFINSGIILVVIAYPSLVKKPGILRSVLLAALVLVIASGVFFSANIPLESYIKTLPAILIKNNHIQYGKIKLWVYLMKEYEISFRISRIIIAAGLGLISGFILLLIACIVSFLGKKKKVGFGLAAVGLLVFCALAMIRTPLMGYNQPILYSCSGVLQADRAAGKIIIENSPPGSWVYWSNSVSPLPLTYILSKNKIYPPQLSGGAAFRVGGNANVLLKKGFWNEELASQWKDEADLVMMDGNQILWESDPISKYFKEIAVTNPLLPCDPFTSIHIYQRISD